ncbi:MAG TPA: hypothetical protein VGQ57_20925 [Polyangiaceae bacterium]|jgi:hypothetical protein|nr:hypothetical protein [Polyangiaceae bacterium]
MRISVACWLVVAPLAPACSKPAAREVPKPASTSAAAPLPARPSATPATPSASVASRIPTPAELAFNRWNELHNQHDAKGLAAVYADTVDFYGQKLAKARVLAIKASAFEKTPDFDQTPLQLKITNPSRDWARAEFEKSWRQNGTVAITSAVLELERIRGTFLVTKETDGPSELRKMKTEGACENAVIELVLATEPARALLMSEMPPDVHMGLRIAGGPPDQPVYAVAVHESHPDHLATLAWYDVDPKTGSMRDGETEGPPLKVDPALARKVVAACK